MSNNSICPINRAQLDATIAIQSGTWSNVDEEVSYIP